MKAVLYCRVDGPQTSFALDEPPFALVCGWRYPLLIIAKGGSFSTVSTLRLFSSTSLACGFLYE